MPSISTAEAIRRQRRLDVPVPGTEFVVVVEIPTDMKFFRLMDEHSDENTLVVSGELVKACAVDWKGVQLSDLLSSGTEDPAPFDREAFAEWYDDMGYAWAEMGNAIMMARKQRKEQREADAKK